MSSILPPQVSSPKHTIFAFINLYLNCVIWRRLKYTKRGRDYPKLISNRGEKFGRRDGRVIEGFEADLLFEAEEEFEKSGHEDGLAHALPTDGHGRVVNLELKYFQTL